MLDCLPTAALETLAARAQPRHYEAGETVFEEGSPGDCMHLVRAGALEVRRTEGVERYVLARLVPGHAFGELAVLDRTPRTATVVAVDGERDRVDRGRGPRQRPRRAPRRRAADARRPRPAADRREGARHPRQLDARAARARAHPGPPQLAARDRPPARPGRGVARPRDRAPHHAHEPRLRPPRPGDRDVAGRLRDAPARRADARHRQGRRARLDPPQGRAAGRRRARPHAPPHHGRRRDPLRQPLADRADGRGDRA